MEETRAVDKETHNLGLVKGMEDVDGEDVMGSKKRKEPVMEKYGGTPSSIATKHEARCDNSSPVMFFHVT